MTRLQKKCFIASAGMHGLLLLILVASSAFRSKPPETENLILTVIPANILDRAGAGGGSPAPAAAAPAPPQPAPAVVQPQPPAPQQHTEPSHETPVPPPPKPREVPRPREPDPEPQPEPSHEASTEPAPKPSHKTHEIHLSFDPATPTSHKKSKIKPTETPTSESSSVSSASESRRLRQQIAQSLDNLASGVKNSGAQGTVVDMPGQGGGEAFAGYETVIYNAYYHAWTAPDNVADKLASTDVKIVVARDGTILSAEIVNKSGEPALDKSIERALRAVRSLPPFPAGARDEQRSFLIRFNLESKEGTG